MKRFFGWKPSAAVLALVFILGLVLMLIPLLRLTEYAVPWYDDYTYGLPARLEAESGGGLQGILKGAWYSVRTSWYAWQGTYASILFMSLMPGVWGEQFYFIGPVILILLPVLALFALTGVTARDVLGFDRCSTLSLQAVVTGAVLMLVYSAKEGFYWYNSGVHYVGMHALCLLMTAMAVKLLKTEGKVRLVLLTVGTVLGAFLSAGANFVTALQGLLLLLTVAGVALLKRNRRFWLLLPALLGYGAGFYLNVTAPGNQKRMEFYVGWGYGPLEAVLRSFQEAFRHLAEFTGVITLLVLLLLAPIIWRAVKKSSFCFACPGLVLAWSVCLYASGFTPSLYSLGHAGLSRTLNAVKITYQLLLFLNEAYWLGYLCRRLEKKGKKVWTGEACWWFYPVVAAAMLLTFSMASNQAGNYSAYGAYYYIHTGEAYNFYHEYLDRVALLKGGEQNVVVEPYHFRPWFLCMGDWAEDADNEVNRAVASWYGKDSVRTAAP